MLTWVMASLVIAQPATPAVGAPVVTRLMIGQEGATCLVELDSQSFAFPAGAKETSERKRLEFALRALRGRNVELHVMAMPGHEPQYRCIGGIIFSAQRFGLRVGIVGG